MHNIRAQFILCYGFSGVIWPCIGAKARKPFMPQHRNTVLKTVQKSRTTDARYTNETSSDAAYDVHAVYRHFIILHKSRPKYDSQRPKRTPGGSVYTTDTHTGTGTGTTHTRVCGAHEGNSRVILLFF